MKVALLVTVLCGMGLAQATPARAATASVAGPNSFGQLTLRYVADPGEANDVFIAFAPDPVVAVDVTDSGATITAGAGCAALTLHKVRCDVSSGDQVNASLGDRNDIFSISHFFDSAGGRLSGGDGDDLIRGNDIAGTNEILLGGPGDDVFFGRGGSEFLDGGPGADDLSGGTSCEGLTAGICATDSDIVSYGDRTKRVHATADGIAADDGQRREHDTIAADVERIIGGAGNDFLGGTTTNVGFLGSGLSGMQLEGGAGNDFLRGGRAPDRLDGGSGDDRLRGAGGRDYLLSGGRGDDHIDGGSGRDTLHGNGGRDRLLAKDGQPDHVNGGPGTDEAKIDAALDRLTRVEELL